MLHDTQFLDYLDNEFAFAFDEPRPIISAELAKPKNETKPKRIQAVAHKRKRTQPIKSMKVTARVPKIIDLTTVRAEPEIKQEPITVSGAKKDNKRILFAAPAKRHKHKPQILPKRCKVSLMCLRKKCLIPDYSYMISQRRNM